MLTILSVDGDHERQPVPFLVHPALDTSGGSEAIRRSMLDMIVRWGPGLYAQQKRVVPKLWQDEVDGLTVWTQRQGVFHICPRVFWLPDNKFDAVVSAWTKPLQVCHSWATLVDTVKEDAWVT